MLRTASNTFCLHDTVRCLYFDTQPADIMPLAAYAYTGLLSLAFFVNSLAASFCLTYNLVERR
jgi:hypothetical protein